MNSSVYADCVSAAVVWVFQLVSPGNWGCRVYLIWMRCFVFVKFGNGFYGKLLVQAVGRRTLRGKRVCESERPNYNCSRLHPSNCPTTDVCIPISIRMKYLNRNIHVQLYGTVRTFKKVVTFSMQNATSNRDVLTWRRPNERERLSPFQGWAFSLGRRTLPRINQSLVKQSLIIHETIIRYYDWGKENDATWNRDHAIIEDLGRSAEQHNKRLIWVGRYPWKVSCFAFFYVTSIRHESLRRRTTSSPGPSAGLARQMTLIQAAKCVRFFHIFPLCIMGR